MAKVKFLLQSNKTEAPIYLRLSLGKNISYKRKIGLFVNAKNWSSATGLPKQNSPKNKNLTSKLKSLDNYIIDKLNDSNSKGDTISGNWLEHHIGLFFNRINEDDKSELLIDAIQKIIDTAEFRKNAKGGIGLSLSRVKSYMTLKKIIIAYQKNAPIKIKDVNVSFTNDFLKYMIHEKKYSQNYASKKLSDIKVVCNDAELDGIETSKQLKKIQAPARKNDNIIFLTPQELHTINKTTMPNERLENAKKWLLLGCSIGQRGGDLLALTEDNFVNRNGLEVIELKQQKTDKNVTIPVLQTTKEILKEGLPYKISIQKLNEYIKEVCKIAKIDHEIKGKLLDSESNRKATGVFPKWQLVSSHICRRSFATNQYGILPTPLIMQITAHGTEKMFLNYIGKSSLDYARQIADFYQLQAQKEKKETQLKVVKNASGDS